MYKEIKKETLSELIKMMRQKMLSREPEASASVSFEDDKKKSKEEPEEDHMRTVMSELLSGEEEEPSFVEEEDEEDEEEEEEGSEPSTMSILGVLRNKKRSIPRGEVIRYKKKKG